MPVSYSSPGLPVWLSWKEDSLTGIPPPDAQSCDVTVEARVSSNPCRLSVAWAVGLTESLHPRLQFIQDGKEEVLTHTVHITIAPMAAVDASFTPSRRPSLVGDIHNPRRIMSDSVVGTMPPVPPTAQRCV